MGAQKIYDNERHFQTLREQLSLYGLNPVEWTIYSQTKRRDSFELAHRADPTFRLNVQVRALRTGRLRVDRLSIISL